MDNWIEGKPTEPGHYWVCDKLRVFQAEIGTWYGDLCLTLAGSGSLRKLEDVNWITYYMLVEKPAHPKES